MDRMERQSPPGLKYDLTTTPPGNQPTAETPPTAPPAKTAEQLAEENAARKAAYYGVRPGVQRTAIPEIFKDDPTPMEIVYKTMGATASQEFSDLFPNLDGPNMALAQRWIAAWSSGGDTPHGMVI